MLLGVKAKPFATFVAIAAMATTLAACGSSGGSGHSGQGQITVQAQKGYTHGLPSAVAGLYAGSGDPLGKSAYAEWKPVKTPWTLCFNNSYLGNTWRKAALDQFNALANQYKQAGLVKNYVSTNSNLNLAQQIQQMRDMIHVRRCSGIITIPTGTSGMNGVIQQAYKAGIPVVTDLGATTSPYAENFDENWYVSGFDEARYLAKAMGGKGSLLYVAGIPGETINVEYQRGLKDALKKYPNIHVVGTVTGKVTESVAQGAVAQFLATHPQRIDGVFQEGGMGAGILAAFQQQKRPIPALVFVGSGSMVSIFHDMLKAGKRPNFYGVTDPPGWTMKKSFNVLVRLLEGQHPKNMTIFYPPPKITAKNVDQWWSPDLNASTTKWPEPPTDPLPDSAMNQYFTNGAAPLPYQGHGG